MVFSGVSKTECIWFKDEDKFEMHSITLSRGAEADTFTVSCDERPDWRFTFKSNNSADYTRIKYNVMETMFSNVKLDNLFTELTETFEDGFEDILVK